MVHHICIVISHSDANGIVWRDQRWNVTAAQIWFGIDFIPICSGMNQVMNCPTINDSIPHHRLQQYYGFLVGIL